MLKSIIIIISLLISVNSIAQDKTISNYKNDTISKSKEEYYKEEYYINNKEVSKDLFNQFLSSLQKIPNTWSCAMTTNGGCTTYSAKDKHNIIYNYRDCIDAKNRTSISSIAKEDLF